LERTRECTLDLCQNVCDIGHVLGLSWFMWMMSMLSDVMRVVVWY
jgi:hypothetical protein